MADQQPDDPAPAAGLPDPTTVAGVTGPAAGPAPDASPSPVSGPAPSPVSGSAAGSAAGSGRPDATSIEDAVDPATMDLPAARWSGAAAVPDPAPRRSVWARLRDRVGGTPPAPAEPDHWATMPAVDPWADQDTPVWAEGYTTHPLRPAADMPPTRLDGVPAPTRLDAAAPYAHAASPSAAKAADVAEKAMADALAAGAKVVEAARTAAALAAARAAEQAVKAGQAAKTATGAGGDTVRADAPATPAAPRVPGPGSHPPPAAGTSLPPRTVSRFLPWRRDTAAKTAGPPRVPVQARPAAKPVRPAPPPWAARPKARRGPIRRMMRRMSMFTVVGLVLCCGGPLAYWQVPTARQFPVDAVLPSSFADLSLRDTTAGRRAAERLAEQLQDSGATGDAFAGIYADGRGKRVTLFGVTGWRLTPGSDVDAQLERLTDELKLKDVQAFDVGEFGAHERCGVGRLDGTSVVACAWADHGSLATVLLTRRNLTESAQLVAELRDVVLTPKYWG